MKALFKYRVTFQTELQVDGWTDPANDLEYKTIRETVTVKAHNERHAGQVAVKQAWGYMTYHYPRHIDWYVSDIKSIKRIKTK